MKINKKIVGYSVNKQDSADKTSAESSSTIGLSAVKGEAVKADVIQMHETLQRPEKLIGSTYKLKVPEHVSGHAMYITINDIVLNEGTEHESRRPFEVFINSKNLEHYQWIVALTLIMSAVFRKGGDITFLVEELQSVFDPRGGYWNKGKYMPSIIAELGNIIEEHLIEIGMLKKQGLSADQQKLIDDKKAELMAESAAQSGSADAPAAASDLSAATPTAGTGSDSNTQSAAQESWQANASQCKKCHQKAVVVRDGCQTCLNCGDSKCG